MLCQVTNLFKFPLIRASLSAHFRWYSLGEVRVRFAPSPTGYLHLGGLRTALYNYLFAKKNKGVFILRIEDTDQTRKIDGAAEALKEDLLWSGIEIHEGPWQGGQYGPYVQSQRLQIYQEQVQILLENGSAYPCFCTDRRLQLLKREATKAQQIPKYDNRCRHLSKEEIGSRISKGEEHCVRFKMSDGDETFNDLIFGPITYNVALNEGDPVIVKSDGYPTYHFANVVDDHLMKISHVLRGAEWQISTTKHLMMYRAFGWTPPRYGHLPLLMNSDGTKLSKRQGDIRISTYREDSIFPLALINFIVNSGGGFQKDLERHLKPSCYTIDELSKQFDLSNINSHSGRLMNERLLEYNKLELKRQYEDPACREKLVLKLKALLKQTYPDRVANYSLVISDDHIRRILHWSLSRVPRLSDLFSRDLKFLWSLPVSYKVDGHVAQALVTLKKELAGMQNANKTEINALLRQISGHYEFRYSNFMKILRTILSGLKEGPSVAEIIEILGKEHTIRRINLCLNKTTSERTYHKKNKFVPK